MKMLVVEDDAFTNRMLEKYLTDMGFDVTTADNGLKGWERFCQGDIHFVVTDWMMPEMSGLELIGKIRGRVEDAYCYIILLTAKNDKDEIVEGISNGADDYIVKPFYKEELTVRVHAGRRIIELQEKLFRANEALQKLSVTDPLTGLYNRRALSEYLKQGNFIPGAKEEFSAFIMADIDHFKTVNDIYGHDAGDVVLKEVANRITKNAHGSDMVARVGGEEFFVVIKCVDSNEAKSMAEEMRKDIEMHPVVLSDNTQIFTTCSFGVFCVKSPCGMDGEGCMKMADRALYESKNSGRNKVTVSVQEKNDPSLK